MLNSVGIWPSVGEARRVCAGEPVLQGRSVSTELSRLLPAVRLPLLPPAIVFMRVRGEAALGCVKYGGGPPPFNIPESGLDTPATCCGLPLV